MPAKRLLITEDRQVKMHNRFEVIILDACAATHCTCKHVPELTGECRQVQVDPDPQI